MEFGKVTADNKKGELAQLARASRMEFGEGHS
jgi:hypothetical protein